MPQIDKVTFFPIVFWTFAIYLGSYLLLNTTVLYAFLSSLKLSAKRARYSYGIAGAAKKITNGLMLFPLVNL